MRSIQCVKSGNLHCQSYCICTTNFGFKLRLDRNSNRSNRVLLLVELEIVLR